MLPFIKMSKFSAPFFNRLCGVRFRDAAYRILKSIKPYVNKILHVPEVSETLKDEEESVLNVAVPLGEVKEADKVLNDNDDEDMLAVENDILANDRMLSDVEDDVALTDDVLSDEILIDKAEVEVEYALIEELENAPATEEVESEDALIDNGSLEETETDDEDVLKDEKLGCEDE